MLPMERLLLTHPVILELDPRIGAIAFGLGTLIYTGLGMVGRELRIPVQNIDLGSRCKKKSRLSDPNTVNFHSDPGHCRATKKFFGTSKG